MNKLTKGIYVSKKCFKCGECFICYLAPELWITGYIFEIIENSKARAVIECEMQINQELWHEFKIFRWKRSLKWTFDYRFLALGHRSHVTHFNCTKQYQSFNERRKNQTKKKYFSSEIAWNFFFMDKWAIW